MLLMLDLLKAALHGPITGQASTQQPCCLAHLLRVLALVSIILHSFHGSKMQVGKNYMTAFGMKWA